MQRAAVREPTMNQPAKHFQLPRAPIVEAVIDIDCDYVPGTLVTTFEKSAREAFKDAYPKFRAQLIQEHKIDNLSQGDPKHSVQQRIQSLLFPTDDEKQLIQIRAQGFSFNRLAPYASLDEYLPEIERTWKLFVEITKPVQVRKVGTRYINRIMLPMQEGRLELADYLKVCPQLPDEEKLTFVGFLNHHSALEAGTNNQVNILLTSQQAEGGYLPLIFDIEAFHMGASSPGDWSQIQSQIASLRSLKNRVFQNTLTDKCLNLFQQ
jgi:uncharacterized protein (TIGR04255 family)